MPIPYQNQWPAVPAQAMTANATAQGLVSVPNTDGFFVLQNVILSGTALPTLEAVVVEVISPTQLYVGPKQQFGQLRYRANAMNLSAYTTAAASQISAPQQNKIIPPPNSVMQATFMAEPVLAQRVVLVDDRGQPVNKTAPVTALRASTVMTLADVASSPMDISSDNMVEVLVAFTKGSLTSAILHFEVSDDGVTWYPVTTPNGAITVAGDEAQQNQLIDAKTLAPAGASANYRFVVYPVENRYFRVVARGVGTVTGSTLAISAFAGAI